MGTAIPSTLCGRSFEWGAAVRTRSEHRLEGSTGNAVAQRYSTNATAGSVDPGDFSEGIQLLKWRKLLNRANQSRALM